MYEELVKRLRSHNGWALNETLDEVADAIEGLSSLINHYLIEVPEPHGRLIDADALAEDLDFDVENDQRALDQMDFVGKERERIQFDKDCKQNCMWYLSEAPTVIPASKEG